MKHGRGKSGERFIKDEGKGGCSGVEKKMTPPNNISETSNQYVNVRLPAELIRIIDEKIVGKFGYRSRAEFIKEAVRKELRALRVLSVE
jgi:hypothetical protein